MNTVRDKMDMWNPDVTYVIGHQRPDTDAIASALGYAWYLQQTGHENVVAARAGQPNEQAVFVLDRFGQTSPRLVPGVAPTFGHAATPQKTVAPDDMLPAAMARVAEGDRVIPIVDAEGKPVGVVTSLALARAYTAPVNVTVMLAQPCKEIAIAAPIFNERDRLSDHRNALLRSETDDFLVVSDSGQYVGIATRRVILNPPRARLFLVDHNEIAQAVPDADEAEIIGVLDHHRLGNSPTALPIPFVIDPVGSTSTLVTEHCQARGLELPAGLAGTLLSGILSDTLVFRSPTTTERDEQAAIWLAQLAKVEIVPYGEELLRAAPGIASRSADEILDTDRKTYQMGGNPVSIAQVEVTGFQELPHRRDDILAAMEDRRGREGLSLIALMITDIITGRSHLLCQGENRILAALPFTRIAEREYDLEDIVSRKKQLVPSLLAVLDDTQ